MENNSQKLFKVSKPNVEVKIVNVCLAEWHPYFEKYITNHSLLCNGNCQNGRAYIIRVPNRGMKIRRYGALAKYIIKAIRFFKSTKNRIDAKKSKEKNMQAFLNTKLGEPYEFKQ